MPSQTATILVTDLVGSTQLRARLGEERAERLRRLHDRLLRTSVETHGGVVVKGLGDGVPASFSKASGAVAAAVAIQQASEAHTRRHPDEPLMLRVGLSAGDVTVESDGDCFGTPVIEATRLCAAAQAGRILAAEVVRILSRGRGGHEFTAAGELELKGLSEPVVAVEIGWQRQATGDRGLRFPDLLAPGGGLGFAGRTAELELLTTAWKRDPHLRVWSRAVCGHALFLTGELREARQLSVQAKGIAEETGQPGLLTIAYTFHAAVLDALGDHEEARGLSQAMLEVGQQAGFPDAVLWYVALMSVHWLFEGEPHVVDQATVAVRVAYPRLIVFHAARAFSLALARQNEDLARLLAGLPVLPVDLLWLMGQFFYAAGQGFGVENRAAAEISYGRLLPYRSLHGAGGTTCYFGPIELALAITARVIGDLEQALGHHEAAAAAIERNGAARARALNGYQWARTLLARDASGDRRRAAEMAEETLAYSRARGYTTFTGLTEELLATLA